MSSIAAFPISSLEHAAMLETAKSVWSSRITHYDAASIDDLFKSFDINDFPLPNILIKRLEVYLDTLRKEIERWVINHIVRIFPNRGMSYLVPCLMQLVWRIDGTIDYESTAKALLEMQYLSELEKFEIAKSYFFLDYINEKWLWLSDDKIKPFIDPRTVFEIMLEAGYKMSSEQLIAIHKRFEHFVNWYFEDLAGIVGFKFSRIVPFLSTSHEARVRVILHGLGYDEPLPA